MNLRPVRPVEAWPEDLSKPTPKVYTGR